MQWKRRWDRRGFTALELLVVIAILGSLMALEIPSVQSARKDEIKPEIVRERLRRPGFGERKGELPEGFVLQEGESAIADLLALDPSLLPDLRRRLAEPGSLVQGIRKLDENEDGRVDLEEIHRFDPGSIDPALAHPLKRALDTFRRETGLGGMTESERRSVSVPVAELARRSRSVVVENIPSVAVAPEGRIAVTRPLSQLSRGLPVIRGEGAALPQETLEARGGTPPGELTLEIKNSLLAGIGRVRVDLGPWRVTPDAPIIEGRADLAYEKPYLVDLTSYDAPAAYFRSRSGWTTNSYEPESTLILRFHPPSPGPYLVDCRVRNAGETYEVEVYPGGTKQTFTGTEHLTLVYQALDRSIVRFFIRGDHPEDQAWKFYGCEVTPVE